MAERLRISDEVAAKEPTLEEIAARLDARQQSVVALARQAER